MKAKDAAEGRGVWVGDQMTDGTRSIRIEADTLDVTAFDHTLDQIAGALAGLGDPDVNDVRRAKAVGVIADPQGALDLLSGSVSSDVNDSPIGTRAHRPGSGRPKVTLHVHLHEDAITSGAGVGRVEGLGPVIVDTIKDWVGRADVTVKPVLDLAGRASVDADEVPDQMSETVVLRNPCCPFPWCDNLSRNKDNDHIKPYVPPDDGGPPGQTTSGQPRPTVSAASPVEDPRRMDVHDARTRHLPLALTPRPPLPRRPHRHHHPRTHRLTTSVSVAADGSLRH